MSIRNIIRAALSAVARFVVVSTEVMINGVRTVISTLVPTRNTAMDDEAEAAIMEADAGEAVEAVRTARTARSQIRPSEPERVRQAAFALREGRQVSPRLLDPSAPAEMQILEWLAGLDQLQLGMVARGSDADIAAHLEGEKRLRVPLLPKAQALVDERKAASEPLTRTEWVRELMRRAAEDGNEDLGPDDLDDLIAEADALVEARATLADYPPRKAALVSDEDVG